MVLPVEVSLPAPDKEENGSLAAREAILRIQLSGKPVSKLDYSKVAKKTDGFSGADLKAIVDRAVEGKLQQALKEGRPTPLETRDLLAAAGRHRPTVKEWFGTARNYVLYSNDGGLYDDIRPYL